MAETPTAEPTKAKTVSFTVAECSEFHNMGEFHENIATVKEAMEIFEKIPPERMSAIPAVWIRVADKENPEQVTEMDVIVGNHIDLQLLEYIPEIAENKAAQFAIAEMLHAMPDATIYGEVPEEIQKKVLVIESKEKQTAQLKEITDKLEQGVQDVFQSDSYKELLSVIVELAEYLETTTGYLLNGEIGCDLDEGKKEMLELMSMLKNSAIKKVALEQVRVLTIWN